MVFWIIDIYFSVKSSEYALKNFNTNPVWMTKFCAQEQS